MKELIKDSKLGNMNNYTKNDKTYQDLVKSNLMYTLQHKLYKFDIVSNIKICADNLSKVININDYDCLCKIINILSSTGIVKDYDVSVAFSDIVDYIIHSYRKGTWLTIPKRLYLVLKCISSDKDNTANLVKHIKDNHLQKECINTYLDNLINDYLVKAFYDDILEMSKSSNNKDIIKSFNYDLIDIDAKLSETCKTVISVEDVVSIANCLKDIIVRNFYYTGNKFIMINTAIDNIVSFGSYFELIVAVHFVLDNCGFSFIDEFLNSISRAGVNLNMCHYLATTNEELIDYFDTVYSYFYYSSTIDCSHTDDCFITNQSLQLFNTKLELGTLNKIKEIYNVYATSDILDIYIILRNQDYVLSYDKYIDAIYNILIFTGHDINKFSSIIKNISMLICSRNISSKDLQIGIECYFNKNVKLLLYSIYEYLYSTVKLPYDYIFKFLFNSYVKFYDSYDKELVEGFVDKHLSFSIGGSRVDFIKKFIITIFHNTMEQLSYDTSKEVEEYIKGILHYELNPDMIFYLFYKTGNVNYNTLIDELKFISTDKDCLHSLMCYSSHSI